MGIRRFMASQLRQPRGWFGSLVMGRFLNRVNERIVEETIALLKVEPEHQVLEVGFGGGSGLRRIARQATTGVIRGVDLSPEMIAHAKRRFRREIAAGRLQVQLGDVAHLPFPDAEFDRVFTINTIYFWPDVLQGLREICRVLKHDGRAAISIRSKEKMQKHAVTKHGFQLFSPEEVAELMGQSGFRRIHVDHRDRDKWYDQVIVVGLK